jgi:hypothetical protein
MWTRGRGASVLRRISGGRCGAPRGARERWRELAPVADETVTLEDASRIGLPLSWYRRFLEDHFRGRERVTVEELRFALDDPSIRDLLRYKVEQRRLRDDLREVLDAPLSAYDAIAAEVAGPGLASVVREVFPDRSEVTIGELVPEASRPAVRSFLLGTDDRPSLPRVRHAIAFAERRRAETGALEAQLDKRIELRMAEEVGAADPDLRDLARSWFGEEESLSVGQLLLASQVPAFARLLGWQRMMSSA